MATHHVSSTTGSQFEIVVDDDRRILDVKGDWPEGDEEITFRDNVPEHGTLSDVPEHIVSEAAAKGWEVCYYDGTHCRTCYCDGQGHMRCVGQC